ncbi:MAG: hypothetical protein ABIJ56_09745 [Pseudomonadota bacterium]
MALCAISVCFPVAFAAMFAMFAGRQEPPGSPPDFLPPPPEKPALSLVLPSMEKADPFETIANITEKVRADWSGDAVLGYVVLQGVDSSGKIDATSAEGMIMMQFFDSHKLRQAGDEVRIREAKLEVVISNGDVSEFTMDVTAVEPGSLNLMEKLPACDIRTLWKKARELGYPRDGPANIFFPQLPQGFFDKDRDDPGDFYSYVFAVPGFDARDLPVFFNSKDCHPYDFKDLRIIYKGQVEEDKKEDKAEEKKDRKKKGKMKSP